MKQHKKMGAATKWMAYPLLFTLMVIYGTGCIPPAPAYPYETKEKIWQDAQTISDSLEAYVKLWLDGKAPAQIPARLIPPGIVDNKDFYLKKPEEVTDDDAWAYRLAHPVNLDSVVGGLPDPHVTYLLLGPSLAPFGSKLILEGEYPYCRFFSIQVSAPLDGKTYTATRYFGAAEVSIVDADIEPLPGNINPFRPNANRLATNRRYKMEFDLCKGDAVALNQGLFTPPYRKQTNRAAASLLVYQGPWGEKDFYGNKKPNGGKWDVGNVWIRIYAPDKNKGVLGGVAKPKVYYQLPDGRKYFIGANYTELLKRANATMKARVANTAPNVHTPAFMGWHKSFGIVRSILNGACLANGWERRSHAPQVNAVDLGVTGRGEFQAPPGNYEPHATTNNYATYLGRSVTVQKGMVAVLVGKLPTTPSTLNGNPYMQTAQLRYWSICGYDNSLEAKLPGSAINGIMDEDMVLDKNRNYILAYSRPADRPSNATRNNGITWVNWGPTADLGLMMRYVSIARDWDFAQSPNEQHLPWAVADWAGSRYDSTLIGVNTHKGFMGCYLPKVVVMRKEQFEALGNRISMEDIPVWLDKTNSAGLSEAINQPATASSVWGNEYQYQAQRAFDGNLKTRWSSRFGEKTGFLSVDLGRRMRISGVKLFWDNAAAKAYSIDVSDDGTHWTTVYATGNGKGGIELIDHLQTSGRYVRMLATKSYWGSYSLWELEIVSPEMPCAQTAPDLPSGSARAAIKIYPNPAHTQLTIDWSHLNNQSKTAAIQIYAMNGSLLQQLYTPQHRLAVDCGQWAKGSYVVKLLLDGEVYQESFMKV